MSKFWYRRVGTVHVFHLGPGLTVRHFPQGRETCLPARELQVGREAQVPTFSERNGYRPLPRVFRIWPLHFTYRNKEALT